MKIKRQHGKTLLKGLMLLVFATLLSFLVVILLRILEVDVYRLSSFFLFPEDLIPFPYNLSGLIAVVLGFVLNAWANYTLLHVHKIGLIAREPFQTPSTLVVDGPFRFSRNPIYLSVILILLGVVILLSSLVVFMTLIAVFVTFQRWFIRWEETKLEEVFGTTYLEYKTRVSRWL